MDSAYNRLVFNGYHVYLRRPNATSLWRYGFENANAIYRALGNRESFPSPDEFAMYVANSERKLGNMCAPEFVEDNDGVKIWNSNDVVA